MKKEFLTFILGAGLSATGLAPVPLKELLLTVGSSLISFSYGSLLLGSRAGTIPTRRPSPAVRFPPPAPPQPHPVSPPTTPQIQPPSPEVKTTPTAPIPPTPQAPEQPKPPGRKLPSVKLPKVALPKPISENKVPIGLAVIGLILLLGGLALLLRFSLTDILGLGLFIPGITLFGVGIVILFLRLYRRPGPVVVELKRFCMHCGFQMTSADIYCGRCHRQPPSGVDTKTCPNCGAVIPALAKFCRDCGAGQPAASQPPP